MRPRPPWSIAALSVAQVTVFYAVPNAVSALGLEIPARGWTWRVFTVCLVHASQHHLWANIAAQVLAGGLVEAFQGAWRTQLVYWSSGTGAACFQALVWPARRAVLVGASGAIYGLFAVGVADLALNWTERSLPWAAVAIYAAAATADVSLAFARPVANVAYSAHASGAVLGLLTGIAVVRNTRVLRVERFVSRTAAALACWTLAVLLALTWSGA